MTKKLSHILLLATFVLLINCEQDKVEIKKDTINILSNTSSKFEATSKSNSENYSFSFTSILQNGKTVSVLKIFDSSNPEKQLEINNITNEAIPAYKLAIHKAVISEANKIKNSLKLDWVAVVIEFEKFIKSTVSVDKVHYSSNLVQSIFFHNSILNTIKRSFDTGTDCTCTPHPGYFVDKTPFWCQEDYFIDTEKFVKVIIESGYQLNQKERILFDFLKITSKKERFVTIDKLLAITEDKADFMSKVEYQFLKANNLTDIKAAREEYCFKGTDLGCCGSYSGCCWYANLYCLEHDVDCLDCLPWLYCLPGCKPGIS